MTLRPPRALHLDVISRTLLSGFALRLRWHVAGRGRARYRDQDELNAPSIPNPKLGLAAKTPHLLFLLST